MRDLSDVTVRVDTLEEAVTIMARAWGQRPYAIGVVARDKKSCARLRDELKAAGVDPAFCVMACPDEYPRTSKPSPQLRACEEVYAVVRESDEHCVSAESPVMMMVVDKCAALIVVAGADERWRGPRKSRSESVWTHETLWRGLPRR